MVNKLKKLRFEKEITQPELAFFSKIAQSKISLYENGLAEFTDDEQIRIAQVFNMTVKSIFPKEDHDK